MGVHLCFLSFVLPPFCWLLFFCAGVISLRFTVFSSLLRLRFKSTSLVLPCSSFRLSNSLIRRSLCREASSNTQVGTNLDGLHERLDLRSQHLSDFPVMGGGNVKMLTDAHASKELAGCLGKPKISHKGLCGEYIYIYMPTGSPAAWPIAYTITHKLGYGLMLLIGLAAICMTT